MKTVVVIQARTGSTRMPNKVLMPLAGRPLLQRMVERVQAAHTEFELVVATTIDRSDEPIRELCRSIGVRCFSGHPSDLLDRHYRASIALGAEAVVKIPSDCPLIDPAIIDRVLANFLRDVPRYDYVSNLHPASYPDGNDVEVMTMCALEAAWVEAKKPFEREHTTPFIWEQAERFRIGNVVWESGLDYSMSHRWTIDYPEDYEFIRSVYDELWSRSKPMFSLADILLLLHARADIQAINAGYAGVNWYRHHLGELKTITADRTRMPAAM
ncbi:MAG TPA: glycosyltransferase family protein [Blastocatellia bacterium]|nr:glycosyltransferase family protein [Blastocatellia bacterium]